jgi:Na+/H+-dicarboxylate symporter
LALEKALELGGKKKVVNFMLPICASMNFASGMMYEMAACLFFMHILGIHPDITQQILLALACILTGIAVGGIPETSMVSFVTVFGMAGIPLSAIAILMPLDRIVDRVRTMVNIFGNTCGTLIVSKSLD